MNKKKLLLLFIALVLRLTPSARADQLSAPDSTIEATSKWSDLLSFKIGDIFSGRLAGELLLAPSLASGGNPPGKGEKDTIFGYLGQLQLAGSFTGDRDVLRVGFAGGGFNNDQGFAEPDSLNTNMALLSYQYNKLTPATVEYRFAAFNDRVVFTIKPVGFYLSTVLLPNSDYVSASRGALSRFAGFSPIFKIGSLKRGIGFDFWQSRQARIQVAAGLRDSDHYALGLQYLRTPSEKLTTGLAYIYSFAKDGTLSTFTGSHNADTSGGFNEPANIHAVNMSLRWQFYPKLTFGAWGGAVYTDSRESQAKALSTTFLFSLGLSDPFGRRGDVVAVMVGQSPRLVAGLNIVTVDEGFGMQYEAFYHFRINEYFSVTPGFFLVTDPGYIPGNNDIFIASVRAAFNF